LRTEIYSRIKEDVAKWLEHIVNELRKNGVDEKVIRATARAIAAQEAAKIVERRIAEFRNEIEEKLSRLGFDAVSIRELVNELYGKLINDVRQMLDQRIMHILGEIDEQTNSIRDVLDLVSEILRHELTFEEELGKLKSALDEERLEEIFYRMLVRKGILKRRRRKWGWVAVGLGILAAIVTGLLLSPIVTLVILFIVFVVLMRW
jgi:RNA-binding protein YhbY